MTHFRVSRKMAGWTLAAAAGIVFLTAPPARAANLFFDPPLLQVHAGDVEAASLFVDTKNDDINALQAKIFFPSDLLSLKEVRTGSSVVNFWIESPRQAAAGEIVLSGVMPGGYVGARGNVLTLVFSSRGQGSGALTLNDAAVLKNDGQGTAAALTTSSASIEVSSQFPTSSVPQFAADAAHPEPFTPVVTRSPDLFNNQYVLIFAASDKGSGVDHYEVMEVPQGAQPASPSGWKIAESPYLLVDQSLHSDVYVRAIDGAGNFIVVKLPAPNGAGSPALDWRLAAGITGAALGVIVIVLYLWIWRWRLRVRAGG